MVPGNIFLGANGRTALASAFAANVRSLSLHAPAASLEYAGSCDRCGGSLIAAAGGLRVSVRSLVAAPAAPAAAFVGVLYGTLDAHLS